MCLFSDINECERSDLCSPHGECLNTDGSYQCICERGFSVSADGRRCEGEASYNNGFLLICCYYLGEKSGHFGSDTPNPLLTLQSAT